MPLLCVFISQTITLQNAAGSIQWLLRNTAAAGFLYLFLLFLTSTLYGLTGRLWISSLLPGVILLFFSIVSYFKTVINGSPLLLNDLTLAGQFKNVAHFASGQLHLSFWLIASVLLFFGAHFYLFFLDKKIAKTVKLRFISITAGALYFLLFFATPVFNSLALQIAGSDISQEELSAKAGVVMSLYCTKLQEDRAADMYTEEDIEQFQDIIKNDEENYQAPEVIVTPTVIFLMSESFFDVTQLPAITFSEDPVPTFHALSQSCTSGKFLSQTYCGGTAYVEMEMMTGICSYLLKENDTLTSLPDAVYRRLPVITDVFRNYGYSTCFLHSYSNALYNREAIYTQYGFDSILFSDSFPETAEKRGGYISDLELSRKIISLYEEKNPASPLMLFAVSMENHQPFTATKFDDKTQLVSSDVLDEKGLATLNTLVQGLKDADTALGYLVDYFSTCTEPVMLVFWGDHLPNLSTDSGSTVYSQLGYSNTNVTTDWSPDELAKMLSTDYVIWSNYEDAPQPDHHESCNFLGLSVMTRLGFELTDYFSWLDTYISPHMLLYRPRLFVTRNGENYKTVPEALDTLMTQYGTVVHDIVYGDNTIFETGRLN